MEIQRRSMDGEITEQCGCSLTDQLNGVLIGMWQSQHVSYGWQLWLATMKIIIHHFLKKLLRRNGEVKTEL